MEKCDYCGQEAGVYVEGRPVCVACAKQCLEVREALETAERQKANPPVPG